MKQEREIKMDFKRAKQAASELENKADQISKIASKNMGRTMANVSAAWRSQSTGTFQQKEAAVQENIEQIVSSIRETAYQIRQEAKRLYEAEMRAYEIATRRDS